MLEQENRFAGTGAKHSWADGLGANLCYDA